jgi:superfamily II DNA/RNA helicase
MASTLEEVGANIDAAVAPGFRAKMLARGQARAMIWRQGLLPESAPGFSPDLSTDLLSYGYSLLLHGLRYADLGGEPERSQVAYEVAAEALEAVVAKGVHDEERDFHRLVAAAAYHLGHFSARAYSLLHVGLATANLSIIELGLAKLMLRDLGGLTHDVTSWFSSGADSDEALIGVMAAHSRAGGVDDTESDSQLLEVVTTALDGNFMAALSVAMLALERGEYSLIEAARARFGNGLHVAGELNLVSQWWCYRLAVRLIDGLWETSFHNILPVQGMPVADETHWHSLRRLFIGSLYCRGKAEVELWPSQVQAAKKVLDFDANLVLSLPTSAGKTRIAELCILACLATQKRVVFVTPLRALSAQTEVGLRRTFTPLGKTVSSLYGSIGASGTDIDALRSRDIVVATPEKLDFALRSDRTLLDDIGLVVLDEGHMIGIGEREVRYEAQIQRLLRRPDADARRIICLSAILPEGDQLEDFSSWLARDKPGGLIKNKWRPTRLRFGEVDWKGAHAQLNITVGDETPFIPKFLVAKKPTKGTGRKTFPSDQTELCIATAWRLLDDGQTVLVFCPIRRSVLPFAKRIIEMEERGHIVGVLGQSESVLAAALTVGAEWFGADHDILKCLKLGVAVHHGALPTPYRKEIERLLRDGVLKVTVSSPTLAQGLNLAATCLVFHGHTRNGKTIDVAEFRNVVGRAGRAYIDIEGLVLYPMFSDHEKRRFAWNDLVTSDAGREMESGIFRLVVTLLLRMLKKLNTSNVDQLLAYVAGEASWEFPIVLGESSRKQQEARDQWPKHLMSLDTAIFSLLGDVEVPDDQIASKLDEVLLSSLFQRRLARAQEGTRRAITEGLAARAKYIWRKSTALQRRGYFLAGVGLATGMELDNQAPELERLLLSANVCIGIGAHEEAITAIQSFAEIAFLIAPFEPQNLIANWRDVLRLWLMGEPISDILANRDEAVEFIEKAFVYNLPWAMEAVRVRAEAHEDPFSDEVKLSDYSRAHAVASLETGTLSVAAATLIQAGFASRLAAIRAVSTSTATFDSMDGMTAWLTSDDIKHLSAKPDWPTSDTHAIWLEFVTPATISGMQTWKSTSYSSPVVWRGAPMAPGAALRLGGGPGRERTVFSADFTDVGSIGWNPNPAAIGLVIATATGDSDKFRLEYLGPDDLIQK